MIRKKQTIPLFATDITGDFVKDRQEVIINWRAGQLVLDEPTFNGGNDIGPDPFTTVLSGLISCTLTTIRMYIKRKRWDVKDIQCSVNIIQQADLFKTSIFRIISFGQSVTDEQKNGYFGLQRTAKLLQGEINIDTRLSEDSTVPVGKGNYPQSDQASTHTT